MSVHIEWNQSFAPEVHSNATKGLRNAAEFILAKALEIVPIEDSDLAKSGDADAEDMTAVVFFDTPYAARQHEELTWNHDAGKQAKYLEQPFNAESNTALEIVAAQIRPAMS